jgi:hypothetical protein
MASLRIEVRNPVKKITLAVLLMLSAFAWAGSNANPADYTVNIHVSRSRMVKNGAAWWQKLDVVIEGKKYQLESEGAPNALLTIGDYKAKLVKDEHRGPVDSFQAYEFLFPDQKTRKFIVVGQTE